MLSQRQKIWDEGFLNYGRTVAARFSSGDFRLETLVESADERLHLANVYYSLVRTGKLLRIEHLPLADKTALWQETLKYCSELTVKEDRKNFCRGLYALRAITEGRLTREQKKKVA
jgi:hypothetical protein